MRLRRALKSPAPFAIARACGCAHPRPRSASAKIRLPVRDALDWFRSGNADSRSETGLRVKFESTAVWMQCRTHKIGNVNSRRASPPAAMPIHLAQSRLPGDLRPNRTAPQQNSPEPEHPDIGPDPAPEHKPPGPLRRVISRVWEVLMPLNPSEDTWAGLSSDQKSTEQLYTLRKTLSAICTTVSATAVYMALSTLKQGWVTGKSEQMLFGALSVMPTLCVAIYFYQRAAYFTDLLKDLYHDAKCSRSV